MVHNAHAYGVIFTRFNKNQSTGAIFLDVTKAFDIIWHARLIYKMNDQGYTAGHVLSKSQIPESGVPLSTTAVYHIHSKHIQDGVHYYIPLRRRHYQIRNEHTAKNDPGTFKKQQLATEVQDWCSSGR